MLYSVARVTDGDMDLSMLILAATALQPSGVTAYSQHHVLESQHARSDAWRIRFYDTGKGLLTALPSRLSLHMKDGNGNGFVYASWDDIVAINFLLHRDVYERMQGTPTIAAVL